MRKKNILKSIHSLLCSEFKNIVKLYASNVIRFISRKCNTSNDVVEYFYQIVARIAVAARNINEYLGTFFKFNFKKV